MSSGVVVFAVGNRSRGDDAIGPLLLEQLAAALAAGGGTRDFTLIEDYQLQIEHVLDLQGSRLALFLDAGCGTRAPFEFYALDRPKELCAQSTHALPPQELLCVYRRVIGSAPPPAFVLCVRGERFELGQGLSDEAQAHVQAASHLLASLCSDADARAWQDIAARPQHAAWHE